MEGRVKRVSPSLPFGDFGLVCSCMPTLWKPTFLADAWLEHLERTPARGFNSPGDFWLLALVLPELQTLCVHVPRRDDENAALNNGLFDGCRSCFHDDRSPTGRLEG